MQGEETLNDEWPEGVADLLKEDLPLNDPAPPPEPPRQKPKRRQKPKDDTTPAGRALRIFLFALAPVVFAVLCVLCAKGNANGAPLSEQLIPFYFYAAGFPLLLLGMKLDGWKGDAGLFGVIALLCGLGLAVQFRMGSYAAGLAKPAALFAFPCGMAAFAVGFMLSGKGRAARLSFLGWPSYFLALGIFGGMILLGRAYRGGIYLPGNMNPSDLAKPLLVWFLAFFLAKKGKEFSEAQLGIPSPPLREIGLLAALWAVPLACSIRLHDLGLALLLNTVLVLMLFAGTKRYGYLFFGLLAGGGAAWLVRALSSHARVRFEVWLNPFADATGKGWQVLQGLVAMFSGGMWGSGLGSGGPETIPIVTSDFVYAAMAEELGLFGCLLATIAYLTLFSRGYKAAGAAATPFERVFCAGIVSLLAVQTLLNVAGVTKALPMTGITLPFISHGGCSLLTFMFCAGMLCGFSGRGGKKKRGGA